MLNKTVEHAQMTKFQNFSGKKPSALLVNTFSFPGSYPNTKGTLFPEHPSRLLLKLIY